MEEIVVWGVCPIGIHVDVESGSVTRCVVIDEELEYPDSIDSPVTKGDLAVSTAGYVSPWGSIDATDTEAIAAAREASVKALEIARSPDVEFPAWEFGY